MRWNFRSYHPYRKPGPDGIKKKNKNCDCQPAWDWGERKSRQRMSSCWTSLSLLWCLTVNNLISKLNEEGVYTQGYADSRNLHNSQRTVELWWTQHSLSVNLAKTSIELFICRRKLCDLKTLDRKVTTLFWPNSGKHKSNTGRNTQD